MTNNFVIGLLVGGAAVLVGAAIYNQKKKIEKYAEVKKEEFEDAAEEVVDSVKTFKEKIEDVVTNTSEKMVENKDKIDALTFFVGLMTALVSFIAAFFNLKKSFKKEEPETRYYFLLPKDANESNFDNLIKELKEDRRILS